MKKIDLSKPKKLEAPEPVKRLEAPEVGKNRSEQNSKKRINLPKSWKKKVLFLFLIVLIGAGAGFAYVRWERQLTNSITAGGGTRADACTNLLDPNCWTEAFSPQLNQVDGKTNALIVGIDTRESGSGAGLMNTDTIILATVYHDTGKTRLISFPRDLYAPYGCSEENLPFRQKINAIYAYGQLYCDYEDGLRTLSYTIEEITGEEIQYTSLIKLEGVARAIDELGGITVDVEETFVDVFPYADLPEEYQQQCIRSRTLRAYCEFKFEEGPNELNGEEALIYSRMRYYSSDFVRARRQQQVIEAVKEKILSDETSTREKAENLLSIYNGINDYVEVDLNLEMILASLNLLGEVDTDPIKVVLDPNFGGGGMIVNGAGSNFNFSDYKFANIQRELEEINENSGLFKEEQKIYSVNRTGRAWTSDNPIIELRDDNLWYIELITDTKPADPSLTGVKIIDFSEKGSPETVSELEKRFSGFSGVEVISNEQALAQGSTYERSQYDET
ncbi:MAG: LCP family protein, partial [Candidatus Dojkabacteria bacterium]